MTTPDDWDRWTNDWQAGAAPPSIAQVKAIVERANQRLRRARRIETGVVAAGIAGVGAALIHTHDPIDLITAAVTIAGLFTLLLFRRNSIPDQDPLLGGTTSEFVASFARRLRLQLRAIGVMWVAVALNLVFFLPWWISGYRVHRAELDAPIMLASWWFPLLALAALVAWSVRFRAGLRAELERLRELESAYRE